MPGTPSAESRIEGQRIEEVVVDAAVEHVDRLVALRGAHGERAVDDAQVAALDQFGAHLVGEEGVFEIGGVVDARRQHRDGGAIEVRGRRRPGSGAAGGIVRDRAHRGSRVNSSGNISIIVSRFSSM